MLTSLKKPTPNIWQWEKKMGLLQAFNKRSLNHAVSHFFFGTIYDATRVLEKGAFKIQI